MGVPTHQRQPHIFMHACAAWGHNKPLITLAILIAEARPNVVQTILTNATMYPKLLGEINMLPSERLDAIKERIHILNVGGMTGLRPSEVMDNVVSGFQTLYNKSGTVKCETSGKAIGGPDFPSPTFAIIDPFATYAIRGIRAVASPQEVPILSWFTSTAGAASRFSGPAELGGMPNFAISVDEEVKNSGRSFDEVVDEFFNTTKGETIRLPGYPPIYDYEMTPQAVTMPGNAAVLYALSKSTQEVEGTIGISTSALEGEAIRSLKQHFKSIGKEWFSLGPISGTPALQSSSDHDAEILSFLDRMEKQFGVKSVIYVSFGSVWYPPEVATIWAVLEELIAEKVPFIITSPSPLAQVPDNVKQRIQESGIGLHVTWAPQERVLAHSATGWFLTHGGWNSVQEALAYKVPLIFWPIAADQCLNSALITLQHRAAFELIEVRTGENGTKRPYRCGPDGPSPRFTVESAKEEFRNVLKSIRGEEGQIVRSNFVRIAEEAAKAWDNGGEAREQLEALLKIFVD
ncbi:hydroquinone glucosyltransferase [Moniliophthora roreri MCA 2997]|uniref:Hydroquinone glucosyltransferase n=1 Tax=Moniliophthora roreri (strain MCA 2997) TaxID=1381753 RepID=V2WTK9_MONRO|nr:hydroquinone glucosyltransferase [Moniliophthora roreri MCA 2997]